MHRLADTRGRQCPATASHAAASHAAAICDDCQQPGSEWASVVEISESSPGVEPRFLERILGSQTIFQECSSHSPCHIRVRLNQFPEGEMVPTLSLANRRFLHRYLPSPIRHNPLAPISRSSATCQYSE